MSRVPFPSSLAALCAVSLLAACGKGDKTADSSRAADSANAATSAAAPATTPPPAAAPAMTDPNIVAFLDAANVADSTGGALAATKGTNAEVKAFGKEMMRDHHALRKSGQDLAKKLNITPAPASGDTTAASGAAFNQNLSSMAAGAAWDKAYIDHEVAVHQAVLQQAQAAAGATQNAELKSLIDKAAPNIQAHLDHARSIQSKLQ